MAKRKSDKIPFVEIEEKDYLKLITDHIMLIMLKALKEAGIEKTPLYKCAESIIKDGHVEVHIKPMKHNYR